MAFQEAREQMSEIVRWTEQPKDAEDRSVYLGSVLTGYYTGKKTDVGQNGSNLYEIQMSEEGPNYGRLVAIWGSSLLDGRFDEVPLNSMVRITCLGIAQPKTPRGRAYMNFKVEYDKDSKRPANLVEAARAAQSVASAAATGAPAYSGNVAPAYSGNVALASALPPQTGGFNDGFENPTMPVPPAY